MIIFVVEFTASVQPCISLFLYFHFLYFAIWACILWVLFALFFLFFLPFTVNKVMHFCQLWARDSTRVSADVLLVCRQVISLAGWVNIMYYVQDSHSFWDWIYFVSLIVVSATVWQCLLFVFSFLLFLFANHCYCVYSAAPKVSK